MAQLRLCSQQEEAHKLESIFLDNQGSSCLAETLSTNNRSQ